MPLPFRTTTLTAAHSAGGVRIYSRTPDGFVREFCNNTAAETLDDALLHKKLDIVDHRTGWFPGQQMFQSSPDSALCSFAWAAWSQSVFYQDDSGNLHEWQHLNEWKKTGFMQERCLVGTNIAAVYSSDGAQVVLFFQDDEGWVCSRTATVKAMSYWVWKDAKRIAKAVPGTGIGATATNDLKDIRLFFQDEQKKLCEYKGAFGADINVNMTPAPNGLSVPFDYEVGDITAISWGANSQIRVYLQDKKYTIVEYVCDGGKWQPNLGNFSHNGLPDTDIIAYVRNEGGKNGFCVVIIWTGSDQELYQSVWSTAAGKWSSPMSIGSVRGMGEMAGSWTGQNHFREYRKDERSLDKIHLCVMNNVIAGFKLEWSGDNKDPWFGRDAGKDARVLKLKPDEDITAVWYAEDPDRQRVTGLRFQTTEGNISLWYGQEGREANVWTHGGHALAGFQGCCAGDVLTGLAPIWSTRNRGLDAAQLQAVDAQSKVLEAAAADARLKYIALKAAADELHAREEQRVAGSARAAMQAVVEMARWVAYLHDLSVAASKAPLGGPADRAKDIAAKQRACSEAADKLEDAFKTMCGVCDALKAEGNTLTQKLKDAFGKVKAANTSLHKLYSKLSVSVRSLEDTKNLLEGRELRNAMTDLTDAEATRKQREAELTKANDGGESYAVRKAETNKSTADKAAREAKTRHDTVTKQLDTLARSLAAIAKSSTDAHTDIGDITQTQAELDALLRAQNARDAAATDLAAAAAAIHRASGPLDAQGTAPKFAAALLAIVAETKKVERLARAMPVDGVDYALLEKTLAQIVKGQ